ncbi:hypothetical protein N2599_33820 (plasmid) [Rhizobium sullae]|uniref:Pyrroline-5-carboxylate reductase catalytic N-terminal domain-containing protein n=1 Tax=Rhizobium sullae TaxID=50338 RepID=A0ABY5XWS3_RHISU|nr:hypothetical protein [Rhizobium sullae]UWU19079.1 hypothetical protein N2599_33820 [Rhizobium sullae]
MRIGLSGAGNIGAHLARKLAASGRWQGGARRGELRLSVPFGYIWHREAGLGLDPDLRLQEVIRAILAMATVSWIARPEQSCSAPKVILMTTADNALFL